MATEKISVLPLLPCLSSTAMERIGEGSNVGDRPIYLQIGVRTGRYDQFSSFWYVIEDKDDRIEEEEIQDFDRNNISVLVPSVTDKIRQLHFPHLKSFLHEKLVVFNSRVYLFGGNLEDNDHWDGHVKYGTRVIYLDIKDQVKVWLKGPTLSVPGRSLSVAAVENSENCRFLAFGMKGRYVEPFVEFLDDSLNGDQPAIPHIPIPEPDRSQTNTAELLAVTATKVYMHAMGDHYHMGLSFDLQNSEWDIFDRHFHGTWSPGVVLDFSSKSYLFSFGIHGLSYRLKSTPPIHSEQLWVYALDECKWLPRPVQGLPEDDKFRPDPKHSGGLSTCLLQMNQRNKLAFVWYIPVECSPELKTKINCTKFIINATDSDSQHPIFCAEVVSFGSYLVEGCPLINCAPLLIGKDKEE